MRRFRLTGPEVFVGGVQFSRLDQTILVGEDKIAVLGDDDPRGDDLARSPYFEEIDVAHAPVTVDDGASDNASVEPPDTSEPASDEVSDHKVTTTRGKKAPVESEGV